MLSCKTDFFCFQLGEKRCFRSGSKKLSCRVTPRQSLGSDVTKPRQHHHFVASEILCFNLTSLFAARNSRRGSHFWPNNFTAKKKYFRRREMGRFLGYYYADSTCSRAPVASPCLHINLSMFTCLTCRPITPHDFSSRPNAWPSESSYKRQSIPSSERHFI